MGGAPAGVEALSHRQIRVIYFGLMLGVLVSSLDQTIVATALPTIVGDLWGLNHLSWVITAYLLAATATTPLYGKLGDLFGRKVVFQAAIVIFLLGSALSGFSHTMVELIIFRGVQGIGAGGIFPLVMAIIGDVLSPRERGKYQGYMNAVFTFSAISGPAVGGLLTEHLSWRWCFYVNLPIGAVALAVTTVVLHLPPTVSSRRIDYLGTLLLSGAVLSVLFVSVWGGGAYAWSSPQIIGLLVLGAVLVVSFTAYEARAPEPLLPLQLFSNATFRIVNSVGFLAFVALFGTTAYLPLFLQLVTGIAPTLSGLLIMPNSLSVTIVSVVVGRHVAKSGRYKRWPVTGSFLVPLAIFGLSTLTPSSSRLEIAALMVLLGTGMGMILTVIVVALQNDVQRADMGTATASYMFFRNVGSAFGVALYGTVMNARLRYWVPRLVPHAARSHISAASLAFSPAKVRTLPGPLRLAVVDSFARSLHVVFLFAAPVAALSIPLLLFLREHPLRTGAYVTNVLAEEAEASAALVGAATDG